ncbi:MAG: TerD family protein [Prochloraceae cyanobacterium]|nr:TerD family protein [Prochloraceae cyanobacterium]
MTITLQKRQFISLSKQAPNRLTKIMCGLGWDVGNEIQQEQFYDLDTFAICFNAEKQFTDRKNIIYFNNLRHWSNAIVHLGDNLTGTGEGDDEAILVDLPEVPAEIARIVFAVNLYRAVARKQDFSQVKNAFVRLVDLHSNEELARYELSGEDYQGMTGMVMAELYRKNNEWQMVAVGKGLKANDIEEIMKQFNLKLYTFLDL